MMAKSSTWTPGSAVSSKKTLDPAALFNYVAATGTQWTLIVGFLHVLQFQVLDKLKGAFPALPSDIPVALAKLYSSFQLLFPTLPSILPFAIVSVFMLFMSLRSRVFSPLDNSRPSASKDDPVFKNRNKPSWTPPPLAFPIIWTTIALLRTISTVLVYKTTGTLLCLPVYAIMAHLSIGDTWNTINNVEKRLGTAVLGVFFVWSSAVATTYLYYKTLPLAGKFLAPMCVWLSIASLLVYSIWRMNSLVGGKASLLPSKEEGPPSPWRLPFVPEKPPQYKI
jgi:tryptophan-rich sensory protein